MEQIISQYSVVGIVCIIIFRDFLKHLRDKDKSISPKDAKYEKLQKQVDEVHNQVDDMHTMHSLTDPNTGVKVWYNTGIVTEVKKLKEEVEAVSKKLQEVQRQVDINHTEIINIHKDK